MFLHYQFVMRINIVKTMYKKSFDWKSKDGVSLLQFEKNIGLKLISKHIHPDFRFIQNESWWIFLGFNDKIKPKIWWS